MEQIQEQNKQNRWIPNWSLASLIALTLFIIWNSIIIYLVIGASFVLVKGGGLGGIAIFLLWPLAFIYLVIIFPLWLLLIHKLHKHSVIASGISVILQPLLSFILLCFVIPFLSQSLYITFWDILEIIVISTLTTGVLYIFILEFKLNKKLAKAKT